MSKIAALRNDELFEKSDKLLKEIPFSKISVKLKGIIAMKDNDISKVAKIFGVSRNTLKNWARNFDLYGIDGLRSKERKSRRPKLNESQKQQVKSWIDINPNLTLKELKLKISNEFSINISLSGLWYNLKGMNLSYITARPKHYKQDQEIFDEFKKNST
jgi:transposase